MLPTARVQRGPSEAARCAGTGIVSATPATFFSILLLKYEIDADGPQMDIGMVCPIHGGVETTGNRP